MAIVESIFGPTPEQVRQAQQAEMEQRAALYARQQPMERYSQGLYQAGGQLANIGAGMLGAEPREVTAARQREEILSQVDMTTPEGILKGAELARQRGDVRTQLGLQQLAVQRQKEMQAESPFAKINPKDYTPESLAKFAVTKNPSDLVPVAQPQAEGGARPPVARLLEERSKYLEGSEQYRLLTDAIRKETYIKPEKEEGVLVAPEVEQVKLDFTTTQGSRYLKQHSEDLQQVRSSKLVAEDAIKTADELLDNKDFSKLFGKGYSGVITSKLAPDAMRKLNHLKSIMKASGMQQLKGAAGQSIGAMQVSEWGIVEGMIDSLDTTMTEKQAAQTIKDIQDRISGITSSIKETYDDTWTKFPQLYKKVDFDPEKLKKKRGTTQRPMQTPQAGGVPPLPAGFTPL